MVVDDQIEIAEWRVVGRVLQGRILAQALVDRAFPSERATAPSGVAARPVLLCACTPVATAVNCNARDVLARDHLRRLDHHDRSRTCCFDKGRPLYDSARQPWSLLIVEKQHDRQWRQRARRVAAPRALHVGAAGPKSRPFPTRPPRDRCASPSPAPCPYGRRARARGCGSTTPPAPVLDAPNPGVAPLQLETRKRRLDPIRYPDWRRSCGCRSSRDRGQAPVPCRNNRSFGCLAGFRSAHRPADGLGAPGAVPQRRRLCRTARPRRAELPDHVVDDLP